MGTAPVTPCFASSYKLVPTEAPAPDMEINKQNILIKNFSRGNINSSAQLPIVLFWNAFTEMSAEDNSVSSVEI